MREGQILISQHACNSFLPLSEYKYNKPHHHGAIVNLMTGQVECRSAGGPCMVDAYLCSPVSTRFVSAASMQSVSCHPSGERGDIDALRVAPVFQEEYMLSFHLDKVPPAFRIYLFSDLQR